MKEFLPREEFHSTIDEDQLELEQNVSNLPVFAILGRQHHVGAVYHDLATDIVYIFSGMKFYTLEASQFKVSFTTQLTPKISRLNECANHSNSN